MANEPLNRPEVPSQTVTEHLATLDHIITTAMDVGTDAHLEDRTRVKALSVAEHALSQKAAILGLYHHD